MNTFKDLDKTNIVELLNFIHTKATFNVSNAEMIKWVKLLNWCQTELIPKIDEHLLEITKIVKPEKPVKESKSKSKDK